MDLSRQVRRKMVSERGEALVRANARLRKEVQNLYDAIDRKHAAPLQPDGPAVDIKCTPRCTHARYGCCRQVVLCELTEAEHIVIEQPGAVARALPKIIEQNARLSLAIPHEAWIAMWEGPPPDELLGHRRSDVEDAYWKLRMPCAFLGDDGGCTIYEDRPIACRAHFVSSSPELCDRDEPTMTTVIDRGTKSTGAAYMLQMASALKGPSDPIALGALPQLIIAALGIGGVEKIEARPPR